MRVPFGILVAVALSLVIQKGTGFCVATGVAVALLAVAALLCFIVAGGGLLDVKAQWRDYAPGVGLSALLIGVILFGLPAACRADVVDACSKYRRDLVRIAHTEMGLDAPIATLAAQVYQESRCNENARSPAGALGLVQIMPDTATWLAKLRRDLGTAQPLNPLWNLRAAVVYDVWLLDRVQARGPCDKWGKALSSYNGGLGWLIKDTRLASAKGADPLAWFDSVERHNSGRSASNFKENRHYSRVILLRWEPLYVKAGWGPGVCT